MIRYKVDRLKAEGSGVPIRGSTTPRPPLIRYGVHTSSDQLQNTESSPPSPSSRVPLRLSPTRGRSSSLGGTRFQSPPESTSDPAEFVIRLSRAPICLPSSVFWGQAQLRVLGKGTREEGDLGGKNLRDETQET